MRKYSVLHKRISHFPLSEIGGVRQAGMFSPRHRRFPNTVKEIACYQSYQRHGASHHHQGCSIHIQREYCVFLWFL